MIKKSISRLRQFWWIVLPIGICSWFYYLYLNCNLWPNGNCTGLIGKTLWDVLELLIIPATLAGVAAFLDKLERKTDRENANKRAEVDREIAQDNQREVALQNYFDAMTRLILDNKLRNSKPKSEVGRIAQVKTTSTLEILDTDRKGKLVNFLCDLGIVKGKDGKLPIVLLYSVDLNNVHLEGCNFQGAHLDGAYLIEAHLEMANLEGAHLAMANLEGVFLEGAHLEGATLKHAHLNGAHLQFSYFTDTNLEGVNFAGANLEGALFDGARMPNGRIFDPTIPLIEFLTFRSLV
jgi:uncharacterized protein YjbI with pentapeptide repeats